MPRSLVLGAATFRMNRFPLAALLALGLAGPAYPGVSKMTFSGLSAGAIFDSFDGGCVDTTVNVFAVRGTVKQTGKPTEESHANVFIGQFDNCTFTELLSAFGELSSLPVGAFQIDRKLTAASLSTTIDVFDSVSGTSFPVSLSLSWKGTGPQQTDRNRSHSMFPGLKVVASFDGTSQEAVATGTVSDGTTNFTPEQPASGFTILADVKIGSVTITH